MPPRSIAANQERHALNMCDSRLRPAGLTSDRLSQERGKHCPGQRIMAPASLMPAPLSWLKKFAIKGRQFFRPDIRITRRSRAMSLFLIPIYRTSGGGCPAIWPCLTAHAGFPILSRILRGPTKTQRGPMAPPTAYTGLTHSIVLSSDHGTLSFEKILQALVASDQVVDNVVDA